MSNPFNAVNPANPMNNVNLGTFRSLYQMMANSKNPTQAFMQMAQMNPQLKPIAQALQQGQNPQEIFNSMCKQRGINPQDFINGITGNNTNSR